MEIVEYPYLKGRDFTSELLFSASRSSGPGGQNVNKVNTKVELRFSVKTSNLLTNDEKNIVMKKLKSILTKEGELIITSQIARTQIRNKEDTLEKFYYLLNKALTPRKSRIPTKATIASKEKRLEQKRKKSEKKLLRKHITDN